VRLEFLPLLLLAPAAWLALSAADRARARRLGVALGPRFPAGRRRFRLVAAGLLLALVALLNPAWGAAAGELEGADLVVCLDVSRSMLARDEDPDRLTRAKEEIRALSRRATGDRLGLVVFAGEARAMVPLTGDMASYLELLDLADPTSVGKGGTDLGAALEAALDLLQGRPGAVFLLTDGEDLDGRGLAAARLLGERGVAVHCVGLGTELGSKIATEGGFVRDRAGGDVVSAMDAKGLKAIAAATGGTYGSHVPDLSAARRAGRSERRESRYQWPLAAAVALWLLDVALAGRRRP
jgi:Ca-activated chloride channel family protein